tara:strand:- start:3324 stop:4250 length:927 start_codon:yes stop_codon:yes gene_type:complete
MPLWSSSLAQDTMQYEFESTETVSPLEFGIHDNIILNSTDGAPLADAGFRLLLEEQIEKRPSWLSPDDQANCFANNEGWWLRHNKSSDGTKYWDEMLVAIGDLAGTSLTTGLGGAQITQVSFEGLTTGSQNNAPTYSVASAGTLATAFVRVTWNEPVDFVESTMPSLVVTNTRISNGTVATYTATAAAGNTTVNTMEAVGTDWDTIRMNSTDGAPATDAGDRIILETDSQLSDGDTTHMQMETQTTGTQMNFYFTIAGSDEAGKLSVGRQAITLNSSTFKEAGDTETSDTGIMQQVAAEVIEATTVIT